jgi:galactose mutarotase-like enzyme
VHTIYEGADSARLTDDATKSSCSIVPSRGAIAVDWRVGDRTLLYLDESTLADPNKNVRGGIPLLFPSPGKLSGDAWARGDRHGQMKQHGFARDVAWSVAGTSTDGAATATLVTEATDATRARFPWEFDLSVAYSLSAARLRLDVRIANHSNDAMPFAFGIHPYFHVTDKRAAKIDTKATRAFDNVTKKDVAFSGFDLTQPEVDMHLYDHGSSESALHLGAGDGGGAVRVRASRELSHWVVWTVAGKDYVCLEPWTSPANALNTGDGLLELAPKSARELWIEMTLEA